VTPKHLLIIHQGALGDFVLTFPAIIRLKRCFERIDVLCQGRLGRLAQKLGLVDKWMPLESAAFASLYTARPDQRVVGRLAEYSDILLFSLSQQLAQGLARINAPVSCRMHPKPLPEKRIHVADFILQNLAGCGLLDGLEENPAKRFILKSSNQFQVQSKNPLKILIHPGAGSPRKRWPLDGFLEIEVALKADGLVPEFLVGPAEEDLIHELTSPHRTLHVFDDLSDLVGLLKSAGGYIGNDSGASHLAAFLGLPTTVIFGPADPHRWQPIGRAVEVVRPGLECSPCFETEKANCSDPKCLNQTTPETVLKAFYRVYSI
jgi:ADP-heptose:LPS heptosyltransferase